MSFFEMSFNEMSFYEMSQRHQFYLITINSLPFFHSPLGGEREDGIC